MPSFVWYRHPEEAYQNPYEYEGQRQFSREAHKFLNALYDEMNSDVIRLDADEQSLEKALWMLHIDTLDCLRDALELVDKRRHRPAGRMFRDAVETLDLATYFSSQTPNSVTALAKWYDNDVIPHREYRQFLKTNGNQEKADQRRDYYNDLSKFTHRTYRALLKSYRVSGSRLRYDGSSGSGDRILPQTISAYYAILGDLILSFSKAAANNNVLKVETVQSAWDSSMEEQSVPRRFIKVLRIRDSD